MGLVEGICYVIDSFLFSHNASRYYLKRERNPQGAETNLRSAVGHGRLLIASGGYMSSVEKRVLGEMEFELLRLPTPMPRILG